MAVAKTTADLITDVRSRVAAPSTDSLVSDTELLGLADQEQRTECALILIAARSEYWLTDYTVAVTSGTNAYRLPDRALGQTLRDVTIYDASSNEWNLLNIPADQRHGWQNGGLTGTPAAFTLENGKVVLLPSPNVAGHTLRMRYYAAPSRLILTSAASAIDSASGNGTCSLTLSVLSTVPATVSAVAGIVDVVRGAGMHESMFRDCAVSSWSTPILVIAAATPSIVAADIATSTVTNQRVDYVCPAGQTVYPPIPETLWPVLVGLTCRAYCEAIGDARGADAASATLERKIGIARSMLTPRVDGEVQRIVPIGTPLRSGGRRSLGGWG